MYLFITVGDRDSNETNDDEDEDYEFIPPKELALPKSMSYVSIKF